MEGWTNKRCGLVKARFPLTKMCRQARYRKPVFHLANYLQQNLLFWDFRLRNYEFADSYYPIAANIYASQFRIRKIEESNNPCENQSPLKVVTIYIKRSDQKRNKKLKFKCIVVFFGRLYIFGEWKSGFTLTLKRRNEKKTTKEKKKKKQKHSR